MANVKGKLLKNTTFKVEFPTLPSLGKSPVYAKLIQKQNHHDVLFLKFLTVRSLWFTTLKTGVPIKFSWTQDGRTNQWYGYVSFIKKTTASQRYKPMEIACIGASFVLKGGNVEVHTNTTITEVVKDIASKNGLNYIGEPHNKVFSQLTISGHSYWEWIVEYGNKIGYGILIDGTNLIFRPFDKLIEQTVSEAPILSWNKKWLPSTDYSRGNSLEVFEPLNGEFIEGTTAGRTLKHVAGIDPVSGTESYFKGDPKTSGVGLRTDISDVLFSEYRSDQVVHNDIGAETVGKGAAALARFNMPAFVRAKGDPRIRPYSVVYIHDTGSLTDGYWLVKEVTHSFAMNNTYSIEMVVVTDGTGENDTSSFRRANPSVTGIINEGHVVATDSMLLRQNTTELYQNGLIVKQLGQGFKRTPARWVSTIRKR